MGCNPTTDRDKLSRKVTLWLIDEQARDPMSVMRVVVLSPVAGIKMAAGGARAAALRRRRSRPFPYAYPRGWWWLVYTA